MTDRELLAYLQAQPFVLAPMAAITDRPFRSFMRELGCGAVVTELVSATGLKFSPEKTQRLMEFDSSQHPIGVQIFGENLDHLRDAAMNIEQLGADFIDLNFGCPVSKVVKRGAGSACLRDLVFLRDILRTVKSAVSIPVTIKVRTGWDNDTRNSHEVARIASDEGMAWMAIHGRTRAMAYNGRADWDYIREVKAASPIPILGNGDLNSAELAVERLRSSGCDGVLIGRGCLKNPFIFLEAYQFWTGKIHPLNRDLMAVLERLRVHLESFYDERRVLIQMKKFASWYSAGYPESGAFRKSLFATPDRSDVFDQIAAYFAAAAKIRPQDTSHEAFLMGGHG